MWSAIASALPLTQPKNGPPPQNPTTKRAPVYAAKAPPVAAVNTQTARALYLAPAIHADPRVQQNAEMMAWRARTRRTDPPLPTQSQTAWGKGPLVRPLTRLPAQ